MGQQPQIGWQDDRTATGRARQAEVSLVWLTCGWCWGQRVLLDASRRPRPCPNCLGVGQIVRQTSS